MARSTKTGMPSSGAGITRYFEEFKSKIQIKPISVVIIIVIVIVIILLLHKFGFGFLGISGAA